MSVQLLRFKIADDIDLRWEPKHQPRLLLIMNAQERSRFEQAGGPGHWEHLDVSIVQIGDYLFEDRQPVMRRDIGLAISRGAHGRVRLSLSYRDEIVVEREYPERLFHAAFRVCAHVRPTEELFARVLETDGADYKSRLRALAREEHVDASVDAEREAWERTWADARPIVPHVPVPMPLTLPPAPAPSPSVPVCIPPPAPIGVTPTKGPLLPRQVSLFAATLASGSGLPATLSPAARAQVMAYAEAQGTTRA